MILLLYNTKIKRYKKSFSLFEIIISLTILFIIFYTATNVIQILNISNNKQEKTTKAKIEIESLRLYLINKIKNDKKLSNLKYENSNLYYEGYLLLKNITQFSKEYKSNFISISLCLYDKNTLCQTLYIR